MDEPENSIQRAERIKRIAAEYFELEYGELIDRHTELLRVCDITQSPHADHIHINYRVYISRRSVKHFVEERKRDLLRKHSEEEALSRIYFAIDRLEETVIEFDEYTFKPPRYLYVKDYSHLGMPPIRIIVDQQEDSTLEICSIHFVPRKKKKK